MLIGRDSSERSPSAAASPGLSFREPSLAAAAVPSAAGFRRAHVLDEEERPALDRLMEGRTSVIIAHRLATIQRADVICIIKEGAILERGTHEELLKAQVCMQPPSGANRFLPRCKSGGSFRTRTSGRK